MIVHSPEHIATWQKAVADGRRIYQDLERRATYPENPDEDTVAIAEHYRLKWRHARLLKALHYGLVVTPQELSALTGIHPALLKMEVGNVVGRNTVNLRIKVLRQRDGTAAFYQMDDAGDRDEVRAIIQTAWEFSR